jgi:hypothetical protein
LNSPSVFLSSLLMGLEVVFWRGVINWTSWVRWTHTLSTITRARAGCACPRHQMVMPGSQLQQGPTGLLLAAFSLRGGAKQKLEPAAAHLQACQVCEGDHFIDWGWPAIFWRWLKAARIYGATKALV